MRTAREDFFPSELYWLDRVGPVSRLKQGHGGVPTDVSGLVTTDPSGPSLHVAFDRMIEPDWNRALGLMLRAGHDRIILDARVTLDWPTDAGFSDWRKEGVFEHYMILNLYELLMGLALNGAGRIRPFGYPHPPLKRQKFIPMPWSDVWVVGLLVERGDVPSLICDGTLQIKDWP